MNKKYYCHLVFILMTLFSCNKNEKDSNKHPVTHSYDTALRSIGLETGVMYNYDNVGSSQLDGTRAIKFHTNGRTISEYKSYFSDSLVYDVAVRIVQPTMVGELPKIVFTPYDREQHTLLTNMEKWQSLNFLRYTTDSAVLQKGTVVFFESLGKVKYEGPQELRKK